MQKVFYTLVLVLTVLSLERFHHYLTDGFMIHKIIHTSLPPPTNPQIISPQEEAFIQTIIQQKFYYLNSGSQFYVFKSADNKYVIKLFKFQHIRIRPIWNYLPLFGAWDQWRQNKKRAKNLLLQKTFDSVQIALNWLQEETALIFSHLYPSSYFRSIDIELVDKMGREHKLPLQILSFILQKYGTPAYVQITEWMRDGADERAIQGIHQLVQLIHVRCSRGIADTDPNLSTNFAFVEGRAVQIDVGRFFFNESNKERSIQKRELLITTEGFAQWISDHFPSLLPTLYAIRKNE